MSKTKMRPVAAENKIPDDLPRHLPFQDTLATLRLLISKVVMIS